MKQIIWRILVWIDDNINHNFVEEILNGIQTEWAYNAWKKTCHAYCGWLNNTVYDWVFSLGDE